MADITVNASEANQLVGSTLIRGEAAGAGSYGDGVYPTSTGWLQSDADALASAQAKGVVVGITKNTGEKGSTTFAAGDTLDIVVFGPVFLGADANMTVGGQVFVSTTAGAFDQTAPAASGDYPYAIGWALGVDVLFVDPETIAPTVNP